MGVSEGNSETWMCLTCADWKKGEEVDGLRQSLLSPCTPLHLHSLPSPEVHDAYTPLPTLFLPARPSRVPVRRAYARQEKRTWSSSLSPDQITCRVPWFLPPGIPQRQGGGNA